MAIYEYDRLLNWRDYQLTNYFTWASVVILAYEYLITIDDEVKLIWPSRMSAVKALFILSRYTPFINAALLLPAQFLSLEHPDVCTHLFHANQWIFLIGTAFTEILLTIRTWGVWGKDRTLTIFLPIFFVALFAPMAYLNVKFQNELNNFVVLNACFVSYNPSAHPILWLIFLLLMVYDTGLLALMALRAGRHYRSTQTRLRQAPLLRLRDRRTDLANVVFQDGFIFYLGLFLFSAIQVGVSRTGRATVMTLLPNMHRVLHSAAASRVIINIRGKAAETEFHDLDEQYATSLQPLRPTT